APTTFNNTLTIGQGVSNTNALTVNAPAFFNKSITSSMWNVSQIQLSGLTEEKGQKFTHKFTTKGGNLLIFVSGSGWGISDASLDFSSVTIGATVVLTPPSGSPIPDIKVTVSNPDQGWHYCFIPIFNYQKNMPAGSYTITVKAYESAENNIQFEASTVIGLDDFINITVIELPFITPTS
ncbi:MAG: hypothetical protein ACOYMG_21205, partial [Candidatus Methylumidiphilus sp.]